ncbi:unnamed protein product, partial [Owenia fusiformis]
FVKDALCGHHFLTGYGSAHIRNSKWAKRCLLVSSSWVWYIVLLLTVLLHCVLILFEPIQMLLKTGTLSPLALYGGIACTLVYVFDLTIIMVHFTRKHFFRFHHNKGLLVVVCCMVLDYIIYGLSGGLVFRLLRPCIWMLRSRATRGIGAVMMLILPDFMRFLLLIALCDIFFAAIGCHLFMDIYNNKTDPALLRQENGIYVGSFNNIGVAALRMFVLLTTSNYPRFAVPAYHADGSNMMFFGFAIMSGNFLLFSILVARIYDYYKIANKVRAKEERFQERQCLVKAFEILDPEGTGVMTLETWKRLYPFLVESKVEPNEVEVTSRFMKFKESSKNTERTNVTLLEFFSTVEILRSSVERKPPIQRRQGFIAPISYPREICMKLASSKYMVYFVKILHLVFLLLYAVVWYKMPAVVLWSIFYVQFFILILLVFDNVIKCVAHGRMYLVWTNLLDVSLLLVSLCSYIYVGATDDTLALRMWAKTVVFAAILLKYLAVVSPPAFLWLWLREMILPVSVLTSLIAIIAFVWAVLGMELYGHLGEPSDFKALCGYGFGDLRCALLTIFQLVIGSIWHRLMNRVIAATSYWSALYFVSFYTLMQLLVLNVVVAIIVELTAIIQAVQTPTSNKVSPSSLMGSPTHNLNRAVGTTIKVLQPICPVPDVMNIVKNQRSCKRISTETSFIDNEYNDESTMDGSEKVEAKQNDLSDWRRQISGEMTLLDANELIKLSQMAKCAQRLKHQT